jgi:integrase
MKKHMTEIILRNLRAPAEGRLEVIDAGCRGLSLRVTPNDIRSWSYRYTGATGKPARMAIGTYPTIGLAEARKRADALRLELANGVDPVAAKRRQRLEAQSGTKTFGHLAERYLQEHAFRHKRESSAEQDQRNITKHLLPYWGDRQYASIERAEIVERIEAIARTHPILANRMCALVSKMFSFAIDVGLMTTTPALRLKKPGKERAKTRVLTDAEIRLFWTGIVEAPVSRPTGLALRLALLLGLRAGEIAGLKRDELRDMADVRRAAILLPPERTKNKLPLLLPLSPLAHRTINEALELSTDEFVFPGASDGAVESHSLTTAMRRFAQSWKDPPTPHDLRRSCATRLGSLGIDEGVIGRVLNHLPETVTRRHYNMHEYEEQKRAALGAWSVALQAILDGKSSTNVVAMGRGRAR